MWQRHLLTWQRHHVTWQRQIISRGSDTMSRGCDTMSRGSDKLYHVAATPCHVAATPCHVAATPYHVAATNYITWQRHHVPSPCCSKTYSFIVFLNCSVNAFSTARFPLHVFHCTFSTASFSLHVFHCTFSTAREHVKFCLPFLVFTDGGRYFIMGTPIPNVLRNVRNFYGFLLSQSSKTTSFHLCVSR